MVIILDAGHGATTPGKCSPDKTLREYRYCREIMALVEEGLRDKGYNVKLLVTDDTDVSLSKRCKLANLYAASDKDALLVSIHNNAAGADNKWHDANGWSVFVSLNASLKSKRLAGCLFDAAKKLGLKMRLPNSAQKYWPLNLAICRDTNCPAILTENLFQDNRADVAYLLSTEGKKTIAQVHIQGIIEYIKKLY